MRPMRRKSALPSTAAFALPSHWSPQQALAVFESLDLLRKQLWLAYGDDIQRAWRAEHRPGPIPKCADPDSPF